MDCCWSVEVTRRQWLRNTVLSSAGAALAGWAGLGVSSAADVAAEPSTSASALQVLKDHISVDVHSHAGITGITSRKPPSDDAVRAMRAGKLATVCLANVPDAPLLGLDQRRVLAALRQPAPGELYKVHLNRLAWMDELTKRFGMRRALTVADLEAAHAAGEPAMIADIEGLDFLERRLERLEEAYQRGVRHAQLVHYTPNDIGDFQTGDVVHHGLTPFGAEVIQACNRLGIVLDVAHATEDTVKQAVKVATRPMLLSHTALQGSKAMGRTPLAGRQVSRDHARAVTETGGSIGIWHFFKSLQAYVDGLKEMVDVVGVDHVSIGTDQQVSPGTLQDYGDFARLVEAMLRGGFTADEAGKLVGGNYVRIFAASAR
jgi:membrane dipeptidase